MSEFLTIASIKESLLQITSSVIKFGHSFFKIRTTLLLANASPVDFLMRQELDDEFETYLGLFHFD